MTNQKSDAVGGHTDTEPYDWFNGLVRIERLIHIEGSTASGGAYPDSFSEDFCENLPERADAPLYAQCPAMARYREGDDWPDPEEVAEQLAYKGVKGFFVQAAQPVIERFYPSGGYSYSWGYYHTEWLYAPTAADIDRVCSEWSEFALAEDRENAARATNTEQP